MRPGPPAPSIIRYLPVELRLRLKPYRFATGRYLQRPQQETRMGGESDCRTLQLRATRISVSPESRNALRNEPTTKPAKSKPRPNRFARDTDKPSNVQIVSQLPCSFGLCCLQFHFGPAESAVLYGVFGNTFSQQTKPQASSAPFSSDSLRISSASGAPFTSQC